MEKRVLHIAPEDTVKSVQEKFSSWYPYLRINFFRNSNGKTSSQACFGPEVRMADINKNLQNSNYELQDHTSVAGLEKTFVDKFGLPIQVCRRSGNLWLETSLTDHLTLKEQNTIGEEISDSPFKSLPFTLIPYGC
jgi:hypothetical protein